MSYVRNCWYVAGWEQDLAPETPFAIRIIDDRIVIWRSASGQLHALEDRCVHRLAPLSLGRCEGENIRCMYHGLLFAADGRVAEIPGQEMIPAQARVRHYPVVERHSWIWVWMGDPALADPALIPPAVGFDDPDYILGRGFLDYRAEARLINDNLLDFSHLTYVHAASFQAGPEFAEIRPRVIPLERGVRVERWNENATRMLRDGSGAGQFDVWMRYDFLLPGVLLMENGNFPLGSAARFGHGRPDFDAADNGVSFTSQAVTPTGGKTSRYFFSWGPHVRHGDAAMRDMMMGLAGQAFAEDKTMIEAQQQVIDDTPDHRILPITADKGVVLFNRLVEKLSRQEGAAAQAA